MQRKNPNAKQGPKQTLVADVPYHPFVSITSPATLPQLRKNMVGHFLPNPRSHLSEVSSSCQGCRECCKFSGYILLMELLSPCEKDLGTIKLTSARLLADIRLSLGHFFAHPSKYLPGNALGAPHFPHAEMDTVKSAGRMGFNAAQRALHKLSPTGTRPPARRLRNGR